MIEQVPHNTLRTHFHEADQFRAVVTGEGRIGSRVAVPGIGHFVGPIVADDRGVALMTLRNATDPEAQCLSDQIEQVRARRHDRREVMFGARRFLDNEVLADLKATVVTPFIAVQPVELAAASCASAPGGSSTGSHPSVGGGRSGA